MVINLKQEFRKRQAIGALKRRIYFSGIKIGRPAGCKQCNNQAPG